MSEIIEMPYGNGKALEREFVKKYEEVHTNVKIKTDKEKSKNDGHKN